MLDNIILVTTVAFVVGVTSFTTNMIEEKTANMFKEQREQNEHTLKGLDTYTTYEVRYVDETGDEGITRISLNDVEMNQIDEFYKEDYICGKAYNKFLSCLDVKVIND